MLEQIANAFPPEDEKKFTDMLNVVMWYNLYKYDKLYYIIY